MKKIIYMAATVLLCSSCFHVNTNWNGGKNAIKGEGTVTSKSYDLKDFDAIVINGHADATFTQSSTFEVTLRTQENIFDYVDFRVEGSTLVLETKDKRNVRAEVFDIVLQAPSLKSLTVNGSADFQIPAGLSSEEDLNVQVNGAGDMSFSQIRCEKLSFQVNGASDIDAKSIEVKNLSIEVNGAGDVIVSGHVAGDASLEVNGAGDINAESLQVAGEVIKHAAGIARIKI